MRNILGAFALAAVMASQAGAATISGPTTVVAGQTYSYIYDTGPVDLIENYEVYVLTLLVNGSGYFEFFGSEFPTNNQFTFDWIFPNTGPAVLSAESFLQSYVGATVTPGENGFVSIFKPDGWQAEVIFTEASNFKVSVVPIGGTLPLMLSALGLMGWAARRRTKHGALPA